MLEQLATDFGASIFTIVSFFFQIRGVEIIKGPDVGQKATQTNTSY